MTDVPAEGDRLASHIVLIRHSGLRLVDAAAVLRTLDEESLRLPRDDRHVDTLQFAGEVEADDWEGQDRYLRGAAADIRNAADSYEEPELHFFGLAEIPHVIALGAYLGDERHVHIHEYDRDADSWAWPASTGALEIEVFGAPSAPAVTSRGIAVVRVSISAAINDADVRAVVGDETLADVTVRPVGTSTPNIATVRSLVDLERVREGVRNAIGAVRAYRPGIDTIHLFIAAPVSVCFAVGQELKPRNTAPIQTYRYRPAPGTDSYHEAVLVSAAEPGVPTTPLTEEDVAVASRVRREVWPEVLVGLISFAKPKGSGRGQRDPWYSYLQPQPPLNAAAPFPELPPLGQLVPERDKVELESFTGEYGYDKDRGLWRLGDHLLVGLSKASGARPPVLASIIRLFLLHEYLHDYHSLSKYTAREVGKFANSLEYIDYTADLYAVLHQLDWLCQGDGTLAGDHLRLQRELAEQLDLVIRSFWAFEPSGLVSEWQVRRIRRYLNWYWRQIQVTRAPDLGMALRVLARPPKVELAGLRQVARGRRVLALLDRLDPTTHLELAIVTEDERLFRVSESPNTSLTALIAAFQVGDHSAIKDFFRSTFEICNQFGGAFPTR